jgi:Lrp/AsnC family transcriptional regulator
MDNKDKAILEALQEDATMTVSDLADTIGLSKSACWRRIQNLEESGIIGARVTLLNQRALGLNLTVYAAVKTHEHNKAWFDQFHAVTTAMPNVMEVHRMSGEVDYLIRAVVPDMQSYDEMYKEMITIKYTTALPLDYL